MNRLYLISGTSESKKRTLIRSIMNNEIISFTTREPRVDEISGLDYNFITKEDYDELKASSGMMVETEESKNIYGITRKEYEEKLNIGDAFVIVDFNGMKRLKDIHPNSYSIFIFEERKDIEARMRERGDSMESIIKVLDTYGLEVTNLIYYDEVVINYPGEFEETVQILKDIISEV